MSTSVSVIPDGTKRFKSGGVDDAVAEGPSSKKQKIANNNAETLKKKMLQHESIAKAKKVLAAMSSNTTAVYPDNIDEMYCEFMTLKIMNEDYDASKAQLSPGGTVDQFWHIHVLDTAGYASFFWGINDGDVVHHDALKIFDSDELIGERQEKTRSVYKEIFGKECNWLSGFSVKEEQVCPNVRVKEEQVENQKQKENVLVEDGFQLFVKDLDGRTLTVIIGAKNTVSDLKIIIWNKRGYPIDRQRLISDGKQLEDSRTLDYYNIRTLYTIHLYLSLNGC